MTKLFLEEQTYKILGACIEVHKQLGNGFTEEVYHEALIKELTKLNIPFEHHKKLDVFYKGSKMDNPFIADFVCFDKIILEVKSLGGITETIKQQVLKFLLLTNLEVGYLVNFGEKTLTWKRFINN